MGTACNIKINNITYYKHYDGFQGGLSLILIDCIVNNKICLDTFIKKGNLEKNDVFKRLPLFKISETEINGANIYDFILEGLKSIVWAQQRYYQTIKSEDARTRYFDGLRGESLDKTETKMRLHKIFKNGYPTESIFKNEFNLINSLTQD